MVLTKSAMQSSLIDSLNLSHIDNISRSHQITAKMTPSKPTTFIEIKTDSFAKKIFLSIGVLFILIPLIRQIFSFFLFGEFSKEKKAYLLRVEERKIQTLNASYSEFKTEIKSLGNEFTNQTQIKAFLKALDNITSSNDIQRHLKNVYETKQYQKIKAEAHPLVHLTETLGGALRSNIIGMEIFADYGRAILKKAKNLEKGQAFSFTKVGNCLVDAFNERTSPHFDSVPAILLFVLSDFKFFLNGFGALGLFGQNPVKDFNPYIHGNFNIATIDYSFECDQKKNAIRFFHGPTPGITSDRLLSLHLDSLKKNKGVHLLHSMEFIKRRGERERLKQIKSYEDNSQGAMRFYVTPVDGDAWQMKNDFNTFLSASQFIKKYKKLALGPFEGQKSYRTMSCEFYVGPEVMSDEQFEGMFDLAAEIFDNESFDKNPYVIEMRSRGAEGNRVLAKGLQIFIQSLISLGALAKLSKESEGPLTFGQACTEDIDRGAVVNIATRLLMMKISHKKIKARELAEITGTLFGRAELTAGRRIMRNRFEGLIAFLFLTGSHDQKKLKTRIKKHFEKAFFTGCSFKAKVKSLY